jgi:DNA anti-recombination protein RmuC
MTKQDDKRIAALAKKNAAKIKPPTQERAAQFDDTLRKRTDEDSAETERLFKEMKRREF